MTTTSPLDGTAPGVVRAAASMTQGNMRPVTCTASNGGSVLTTGVLGYVQVPFAGTIVSATLLADEVGSVVVDVWKAPYAGFPPTVANTITASALPTLSSAQNGTDTGLSGWSTNVNAGDVFAFNLNSVTSIKQLTVQLMIATN